MIHRFPPKSDQLAIHTVFLPRENILFLREWIAYHICVGVSHFYLYNNMNSFGHSRHKLFSATSNKYGVDYCKPTKHLSDDNICSVMGEISDYFKSYITYVPWQPKDKTGKIVYAYNDSIAHYYKHFSKHHRWTAFIDMDEYIYSERHNHIGNFLDESERLGYYDILMQQKKFGDRFNYTQKYVTEITDCIENVDTRNWAQKHIIKNNFLDSARLKGIKKGGRWGMHNIPVKTKNVYRAPLDVLRFNHYNVNNELLNWMKEKTIDGQAFFLDAYDDGMRRYFDFVNSHCKKKPGGYNHGVNSIIINIDENKQTRHLIFNEPFTIQNLVKPRFIARLAKEWIMKTWRDITYRFQKENIL